MHIRVEGTAASPPHPRVSASLSICEHMRAHALEDALEEAVEDLQPMTLAVQVLSAVMSVCLLCVCVCVCLCCFIGLGICWHSYANKNKKVTTPC